jgi:hypothetical protein
MLAKRIARGPNRSFGLRASLHERSKSYDEMGRCRFAANPHEHLTFAQWKKAKAALTREEIHQLSPPHPTRPHYSLEFSDRQAPNAKNAI